MRIWLIVESGTDVRLVDGLAERAEVVVLARRIHGGVEISQRLERPVPVTVGPASRAGFAALVFARLLGARRAGERVLVQNYGPAALAANAAARVTGTPTFMLVCSPTERYYRCRRDHPTADKPFRSAELLGLERLARLNARWGRHYIVLSEHLAEVVRSHGTARPVSVVPVYGVDGAVFRWHQSQRSWLEVAAKTVGHVAAGKHYDLPFVGTIGNAVHRMGQKDSRWQMIRQGDPFGSAALSDVM